MQSVQINGEEIKLCPLRWQDAIRIGQGIGRSVMEIVQPDGTLLLSDPIVARLLSEQQVVLSDLIKCSTGQADPEWIASLSVRDVMAILNACLALNFNSEVGELAGSIGARVSRLLEKYRGK